MDTPVAAATKAARGCTSYERSARTHASAASGMAPKKACGAHRNDSCATS